MRRLWLVVLLGLWAGCHRFVVRGPAPGASVVMPDALVAVLHELDRDPWEHPLLHEPMGVWVRRVIAGVVLDPTLPPYIGAWFNRATHWVHWQPRDVPPTVGVIPLASALLHEARHGEGYQHCANGHDTSISAGGAFAVQILYLEHHHQTVLAAVLRRHYIGC